MFIKALTSLFLSIQCFVQIMQFLFQLLNQPLRVTVFGRHFGYKFLHQV